MMDALLSLLQLPEEFLLRSQKVYNRKVPLSNLSEVKERFIMIISLEDSRMTQTASKLDKSRNEDKSKDESKEFRLQEALQESEQKEVETKQ